jgi:hypothetical protein
MFKCNTCGRDLLVHPHTHQTLEQFNRLTRAIKYEMRPVEFERRPRQLS